MIPSRIETLEIIKNMEVLEFCTDTVGPKVVLDKVKKIIFSGGNCLADLEFPNLEVIEIYEEIPSTLYKFKPKRIISHIRDAALEIMGIPVTYILDQEITEEIKLPTLEDLMKLPESTPLVCDLRGTADATHLVFHVGPKTEHLDLSLGHPNVHKHRLSISEVLRHSVPEVAAEPKLREIFGNRLDSIYLNGICLQEEDRRKHYWASTIAFGVPEIVTESKLREIFGNHLDSIYSDGTFLQEEDWKKNHQNSRIAFSTVTEQVKMCPAGLWLLYFFMKHFGLEIEEIVPLDEEDAFYFNYLNQRFE